MENKELEIVELCKLHDTIKNSEIRKKGIEGKILPPNSKVRYRHIMLNFATSVENFLSKYRDSEEVQETFNWMNERNYDLQTSINFIDECYANFDDDEFIASLDFVTLSILHYIIEYTYLQIFRETYTENFLERLK